MEGFDFHPESKPALPPKLRRKHALPNYLKIPHFKCDLARLQAETLKLSDQFLDVMTANKGLCTNHPKLVEQVYDHFEQISLTKCGVSTMPEGECANMNPGLSRSQHYKLRISERTDFPELDERNYTIPTDLYKGSYFEECINQFRSPATRVRLVRLNPNKTVPPHIDYDPTYLTRIIIPIFTNPHCLNFVWRKNVVETMHLPADGGAWFLNTGFTHAVANMGTMPRTTLMVSLNGQADLDV